MNDLILRLQGVLSMDIAVALAGLSSLGLALMVITDRLMVGDCYRNNPRQAWIVSSTNGMIAGLIITVVTWLIYSQFTYAGFIDMLNQAVSLAYPYGAWMFLSGMLAVQVLRHYFQAFVPEKGHAVNETAIAIWLASSPIWIFAAIALIQWSDVSLGHLIGLGKAEVSWQFGALMCLTVVSLAFFEKSGQQDLGWAALLKSNYVKQVILLQLCMVAYIVIMSGVLAGLSDMPSTLALLPFFWIGFGAGLRQLFRKTDREALKKNWRRICFFWRPIVVVEVIGMLVFYFEYLAISETDPTLVNLIISAHVALVFLFNLYLRNVREKMEQAGQRKLWFWGIRLVARKLPEKSQKVLDEFIWLGVSVLLLVASILYLS